MAIAQSSFSGSLNLFFRSRFIGFYLTFSKGKIPTIIITDGVFTTFSFHSLKSIDVCVYMKSEFSWLLLKMVRIKCHANICVWVHVAPFDVTYTRRWCANVLGLTRKITHHQIRYMLKSNDLRWYYDRHTMICDGHTFLSTWWKICLSGIAKHARSTISCANDVAFFWMI